MSSLSSLPPCPEMLPLSLVTQNSWAQQNLNAVLSFPPRLAALLSWTWNGKCLLWFSWFENVCCQSQDRNSLHEKQKLRESILIYNRCPVQRNHVILSMVLNRWPNTSCWGRLEVGGGCRFDPIVLFVVNVRFFFCGLPLENISQPAVTEGSSAYSTLTRAWHKCVLWKHAFYLQCSCVSSRGLLNRNPYWEITQQVTHFHPAKANPLIAPSFQTTISINHPPVCPSPPSCCPAPRPSGELPNEIGVSWLKALRLFAVFGMFVMYCSEPSPSVFWSSPCPVSQSQQRSGGRDRQQQLRPLAGRRLGALAASIGASCTLVNEHRWAKKKPKHS